MYAVIGRGTTQSRLVRVACLSGEEATEQSTALGLQLVQIEAR